MRRTSTEKKLLVDSRKGFTLASLRSGAAIVLCCVGVKPYSQAVGAAREFSKVISTKLQFSICVQLLEALRFKRSNFAFYLPVAPRWESFAPVYSAFFRAQFDGSRLSGAVVVGLSLVVVLGT